MLASTNRHGMNTLHAIKISFVVLAVLSFSTLMFWLTSITLGEEYSGKYRMAVPKLQVKKQTHSNLRNFQAPKKPKALLLWYIPNSVARRGYVDFSLDTCCGGCKVLLGRRDFYQEADAVLFHANYINKGPDPFPPKYKRLPHQIYVFWTRENPYHTKESENGTERFRNIDDLFNITMTYRTDSDVIDYYGTWKKSGYPSINMTKKTKVAVMLASDCDRYGAQLRKNFSNELVKHGLKLDRFGSCFGSRYKGDLKKLLKPYKFFMAFENGMHCRDYVTEKFWERSLMNGLVPVIWGPSKSDIKKVAPPHSYIHVEDFASPQLLVKYLNHLDKNEKAYLEYFKWRDLLPVETKQSQCEEGSRRINFPKRMCKLCQWMEMSSGTRTIPSISEWWFGTEMPECLAESRQELTNETLKKMSRLAPWLE